MSKPVDEGFLPGIQTLGDRPSRCNRGRWAVVRTGWVGGAGHRMVPFRGSRATLLDWNPGWSPGIGCRTGPEAPTPPQIKSSSQVRSNPVDVNSYRDHRLHNPTARGLLSHIKRVRGRGRSDNVDILTPSRASERTDRILECEVGVAWSFRTSASSERCIPMAHAIVAVAKLLRRSNEAVEWAASSLDIIDRPAWRTSPRSRPLISEKAF
ncbi:hypothetical protein BHE74_00004738 [Ensete ventricosum]|nr:hypothetical protein BHE74_00004738 [Ensete ventricosum]